MSWEADRDGSRQYCFVTDEEFVMGSGMGHSDLQALLDGEWQDGVREIFGEGLLREALSQARVKLSEQRRKDWFPEIESGAKRFPTAARASPKPFATRGASTPSRVPERGSRPSRSCAACSSAPCRTRSKR